MFYIHNQLKVGIKDKLKEMIREHKPEDIDTLANIWLEASIAAHYFVSPRYWESQLDTMKNIYIPSSKTYVFTDDADNDCLAGFISLVDDHIAALFVSPAYQRKGIGRQLMNYAKLLHKELELCVYAENESSIAFYQSQDFRIVEERIEEHTGHKELLMQYKA